jgi:hypothetical protein
MASPSNIPMVPRDGKIEVLTLSGVLTFEATYENGDVSISHDIPDRIVCRDRGIVYSVRKGNQAIPTVKFTVDACEFTNASNATILDTAEFSGAWASASRTTGISSDMNLVTVRFTAAKASVGDSANAVVSCADAVGTWEFAEGEPGKITMTYEVYGAMTRTGQ